MRCTGDMVVDAPHSVLHHLPAFFPLQFIGRQASPLATAWPAVHARTPQSLHKSPNPAPNLTSSPLFGSRFHCSSLYATRHQIEWHQLVSAAVAADKRLLTLIGEPGIGKTSLALAAAHYLLERSVFAGGVFFARLQES